MPSPVVITGIGVTSAIGIGHEAFFQACVDRTSGVRSLADRTDGGAIPGSPPEPPGLWVGAPIIEFDPKRYVRPRKSLKVMCREIQLCFAASQLAIDDAAIAGDLPGTEDSRIAPDRIGTVFGSEMFYGPPADMVDAIRDLERPGGGYDNSRFGEVARRHVMPLWMLKYLPNMPACHVGIATGARGPNNTLVLGDVGGPAALIESVSCLRRGIADAMITASVGTRINTTRLNYRNDLPIASVADPMAASSRPHDPDAIGVVGGEGSAAFILETAVSAAGRGRQPIATIAGSASRFAAAEGMSRTKRSDGIDAGEIRGSATAIRSAIRGALDTAGVSASDLAAVVSHGCGDPVMDGAEASALKAVLPDAPVSAPIAAVGHCGAASGGLELAVGALILRHRVIPPTATVPNQPTAAISDQPRPLDGDHVLVITHTTEGAAIAVVLGPA